jgi:transcriptional regulator with XRE-family HTH domain
MPQRGQAIPVDDAWRTEVEKRLTERRWSRADLAREVKCSRSSITHLLNGEANQSPLVPKIERVLGMAPRIRKTRSEIERKLFEGIEQLTETERARIYERVLAILEERDR